MELNSEQQNAKEHHKGNLLIIASAGTGKTTTIVERYVSLVEKRNVNPDEILMTTFTNKAAKDMIMKIKKRTNLVPKYIGTMHSLFLRILRDNEKMAENSDFTLITDEASKKKIVREILVEAKIDARIENVKYFLAWIARFKNRGILAEDLSWERLEEDSQKEFTEEALDDEIMIVKTELKQSVNKIYKLYQAYLKKHRLLDFDEILLLTFKLFNENEEMREKYSNKFKYLMVDEAQDLNIVQMRILELLQNENLCLIGDDCQNIYEWRGSSNKFIFEFNENQKKIFLTKNYRSNEKIISGINKIISKMSFKIDKNLECTREKGENIKIYDFYSLDEEIDSIAFEVKKLIEKGEKEENIAVLFRTNYLGKKIERVFRRNKIPCHLSKTVTFFEREEVKDFISFLKLKVNPYSVIDFERVVLLNPGIGIATVEKIKEIANKDNLSFVEVLDNLESLKLKDYYERALENLKNGLLDFDTSPYVSFMDTLTYGRIISDKYEKELRKLDEKLENLEVLKGWFNGGEFSKDSIKEILDGLIETEKKEKTKDKVILSTIHAAKGLEWKNVFLACCNEKILPYYTDDLTKIKKDSELRLFYVAVSRAKDNLQITYSNKHDWKEFHRSHFLDILGGRLEDEGSELGFVSGDEF